VNGGEGLEEIGMGEFSKCTSLNEILIPPAVKLINDKAFLNCSQLTRTLNGGEGLEEIEEGALYSECISLHKILVPPTVKTIKN
jgi:hypothetical protein